jgi:hypothetical protein
VTLVSQEGDDTHRIEAQLVLDLRRSRARALNLCNALLVQLRSIYVLQCILRPCQLHLRVV